MRLPTLAILATLAATPALAADTAYPTDDSLHGGRYHVKSVRGLTLGGYAADFDGDGITEGRTVAQMMGYCASLFGPGAQIATITEVRDGMAWVVDSPDIEFGFNLYLLAVDDGADFYRFRALDLRADADSIILAPITSIEFTVRGAFCSYPFLRLEGE